MNTDLKEFIEMLFAAYEEDPTRHWIDTIHASLYKLGLKYANGEIIEDITPIFKVGDYIVNKDSPDIATYYILDVWDGYYIIHCTSKYGDYRGKLSLEMQKAFKLLD